jgi:hypothetical protein
MSTNKTSSYLRSYELGQAPTGGANAEHSTADTRAAGGRPEALPRSRRVRRRRGRQGGVTVFHFPLNERLRRERTRTREPHEQSPYRHGFS